jgi:hypothetical protein
MLLPSLLHNDVVHASMDGAVVELVASILYIPKCVRARSKLRLLIAAQFGSSLLLAPLSCHL